MTTFDPAMLTVSPSPSPSPSPEALSLSTTALVLQEESAETRITRTWCAICDRVCTLVLTVLDARDELIEEQELWMREWSSLLVCVLDLFLAFSTNISLDDYDCLWQRWGSAKVCLHMEGEDTKALASGCKSHRTLEKLVKGWKAKAILPAVEQPEVATARPVARAVEVVLPAAGSSSKAPVEEEEHVTPPDMGEPAPGGRKSVPAAPRCERCVDGKLDCIAEKGKCCDACAHARKGCSLVPTRKAPKAAPTAHTTKIAKACKSTIELTKHVAASATGGDADESSSEAEVKIIGERAAEEKVIRGSCTIPPCAIKPLPAHAPPAPLSKGKAKAIDSEEVLALTFLENVDLKEEVAWLKEVLASVRYHARTEQVELISMSNWAYSMSQDWATVEQKMSELLD
ncbi:hypothetical protein EV702DRAFT_1196524 [Suillus placidus]|uniref:Uncharacterized protein n=1 Tax=Suillus placidus TaxID=48579 RepID=A0A9P7D3U6_9AGAM|nr:hypothetical protein EV702DRAFT_1196524 [Suillus placidus]